MPEHCQVSSKYFIIKRVAQFSPIESQSGPAVNKIYKIEDNRLVMESHSHHHQLMTITVPDRALIEQIKKHSENLEKMQNTIKIPGAVRG